MSEIFSEVKAAAAGRWSEVIPALTNLPASVLEKGLSDHPCPKCGGDSVIWPATDATTSGSICCRKCCQDNKPTGDGIATVAKWRGVGQFDAAKAIAEYLGITPGKSNYVKRDILELVARDKGFSVEALKAIGAKPAKRGRESMDVVRVPVFNETGISHSYFDLAPGEKGWFKKGEGSQGVFYIGKPKPGDSLVVVEGCKDLLALHDLGFLGVGLPSSALPDRFAELFRDCHVVVVADLDTPGQEGARRTCARLFGIAASVKIARLPGEIKPKGGDDVRDVLKRSNGAELVRSAIQNATEWKPTLSERKPGVMLSFDYGKNCDEVETHLAGLGKEDFRQMIFQRGGVLVDIVASAQPEKVGGVELPIETPRVRQLPLGQLPLRISDACTLLKEIEREGETFTTTAAPPRWLLEGIFTRGCYPSIKHLAGVIASPTIRPDGSILQLPGYDESTRLVYTSTQDFPPAPDSPTREDAKAAGNLLMEVVRDFPFIAEGDKSAWLSLVLTLVGRHAFGGCAPMFAITATTPGSGKGMLADAACIVAYGRPSPRKPYSPSDDEQRKAITATAIEALPSVLLDNVDCVLGGAALDAALTATVWSDRVLGSSKTTGELSLSTTWMATGNNLRFGADLARRVLPIRLAPSTDKPEERTDFEHPDLLAWIREHRPQLAIAALTILRAYFVAGRPVQTGGAWGSFENWSATIRGALVWAGFADPLITRETAQSDDQSGAIVKGLIGGLLEVDETGEGVTAREIIDLISDPSNVGRFPTMREVVAEVATDKGKLNQKKLGYTLRKFRGRIVDSWQIGGKPNRNGVVAWTSINLAGNVGDIGDDSIGTQILDRVLYTHTPVTYGNGLETSRSSQASPAECPKCGSMMIPAPVVVAGYRNFDCSNESCGHVEPRRLESAGLSS